MEYFYTQTVKLDFALKIVKPNISQQNRQIEHLEVKDRQFSRCWWTCSYKW